MRKIIFCLALLGTCFLTATASAIPPASAGESLSLDTYQSPNVGVAGPVTSAQSLADNTLYAIHVQGTFSAFQPTLWTNPPRPYLNACGNPEAAPLFASPLGYGTGEVGADAQFIFATIAPRGCPAPGFFPITYTNFQINAGDGFKHYVPSTGSTSSPSANHSYTYIVRGHGAPVSFKQLDANTTDNYGVYHISVQSGTDSCKQDGWQTYGYFKNQGDCVSYFATDGRNPPALVASTDGSAPTAMNPSDNG